MPLANSIPVKRHLHLGDIVEIGEEYHHRRLQSLSQTGSLVKQKGRCRENQMAVELTVKGTEKETKQPHRRWWSLYLILT